MSDKETITISVDADTARFYNAATPQDRRKMQALLSLRLRELVLSEHRSLQQIIDEAGRKARAKGLTPEILDSILKGA